MIFLSAWEFFFYINTYETTETIRAIQFCFAHAVVEITHIPESKLFKMYLQSLQLRNPIKSSSDFHYGIIKF